MRPAYDTIIRKTELKTSVFCLLTLLMLRSDSLCAIFRVKDHWSIDVAISKEKPQITDTEAADQVLNVVVLTINLFFTFHLPFDGIMIE